MSDVQPYAFGQSSAGEAVAAIGGLDRLGDRLAKRLRALIEPYSGGRPRVTAKPLDSTMFMMWDACVPAFVSLSLYRLHPIRGPVTLRIDAELISSLVDRFYGGSSARASMGKHDFTPTEQRLVARVADQIMGVVVDCWREICHLDSVFLARETNITQAEIMGGEANIVVQAFEVNLGERDSRLIEIVYPRDGIAGLEMAGSDKSGGGRASAQPVDPVWQGQLVDQLGDVRLSARTVLARPNLKIAELVALKPGDVIPIHIARHLPLLIGDRIFAHGTIGEQDGCAAFMIENLA